MVLRKINAIFSLIATLLILDHALFLSAWMLSGGNITKSEDYMPWILVWVVVIHAVISIVLAFLGHKNAEKRKCKTYPKLNATTLLQRISGILMLVSIVMHIAGTAGGMKPPLVIHAVVPPLFFTLVLAHVSVSISKAFITLGIGSAGFIKVADIVAKVICAVALAASVAGFYYHLF